jgi:hypothetical protein
MDTDLAAHGFSSSTYFMLETCRFIDEWFHVVYFLLPPFSFFFTLGQIS